MEKRVKNKKIIALIMSVFSLMLSLASLTVRAEEDTTHYVGVGPDEIMEVPAEEELITPFAFGDTSINTFNEGGNLLSDVVGASREDVLNWLGQHINDTYYLTTPYGDGDYRNPNGDCGGAHGADDVPGNAAMNCTGFIWHALMASGGDGGVIPGMQGWVSLLRNNNIEYRTYTGTNVNDIINTIVRDDGYIEPGDIIWTWDADANPPGLVNGLSNGLSDNHHIGIYTGTYFDGMQHDYNYNKTIGDVNGWWHSTNHSASGVDSIGNRISNVLPKARCGAITVIKLRGEFPIKEGELEILKKSSKPEMTNDNSCYSLANAEFGAYRNQACTDLAGTLVTDAAGKTNKLKLDAGEYWIKELKAPQGFYLDPNAKKVEVKEGEVKTFEFLDLPQQDPVSITLEKKQAGSAVGIAPSMEGAEFTLKFYKGHYDNDPADLGKAAERSWVLRIKRDAITGKNVALLNNDYKVSGDDFYYSSAGRITMPLGTLTVQETKAPNGFHINDEVFVRKILATGNDEHVDTYNPPIVPEEIKKIKIRLTKVDKETGGAAQGKYATIAGAKYNVEDAKGTVVDTLVTDANGMAESKELYAGVYTVKETEASNGFLIDPTKYPVDASNPGNQYYYDVKSQETPQKGKVKIIKQDAETGEQKPQGNGTFKGAVYEMFNSAGIKVDTLSINDKGEATSKSHPLERYTVKEKTPPEGYNLDKNIYTVDIKSTDKTTEVFVHTVTSKEEVIRGDIQIAKFGSDLDGEDENDEKRPLKGIRFPFKSVTTGKVVYTIETNKYGFGTTASAAFPRGRMPYDTYIVTEENTPPGYKPIKPMEVTISEEGVTLGYIIENSSIVSSVSVVKKDSSTGDVVPVANTEFRLLDKEKNPITMTTHYPSTVVHKTFKTDERGSFNFPNKLMVGIYYLEEVNAPEGMLLGELLKFEVTKEGTWEDPLIVEYFNENAMGQITVKKTDSDTKKEVPGAVYGVYAEEDIITADKTVRALKGDLIQKKTTDEKGSLTAKDLFLGKYYVQEISPAPGFTLDSKKYPVELKYIDQTVAVVKETLKVKDEPTKIKVLKVDSKTEAVLADADFEVWNKASGSKEIDPDMAIRERYTTDKNGVINLSYLLPGTYCVREVEPPIGYGINNKVYEFTIGADGMVEGENEFVLQIENDRSQIVKTTAHDKVTETNQAVAKEKTTIVDIVTYKNLIPKREYTLKGVLMDKSTDKPLLVNGKEVRAEKTFKPEKADGTVELEFTFDASELVGKEIVVFEKLYFQEKEVAAHEDIKDKGQTIEFPKHGIKTKATDKGTGTNQALTNEKTKLIDTVTYKNLIPKQGYTAKGVLMDKSTGKPLLIDGKEVRAEKIFKPEKVDGTVVLEFTFDASGLARKEIVIFEKLYVQEKEVAAHEDLEDKDQTIEFLMEYSQ